MRFGELQKDNPIYMLDRDECIYTEVRASDVGIQRYDAKMMRPVVDVSVYIDNRLQTYTLPEDLGRAYAGNMLISTNKQDIIDEVKSMICSKEASIAEYEHSKDVLQRCRDLLPELDLEFKDRQQMDERLNRLEGSISELKDLIQSIRG